MVIILRLTYPDWGNLSSLNLRTENNGRPKNVAIESEKLSQTI